MLKYVKKGTRMQNSNNNKKKEAWFINLIKSQ